MNNANVKKAALAVAGVAAVGLVGFLAVKYGAKALAASTAKAVGDTVGAAISKAVPNVASGAPSAAAAASNTPPPVNTGNGSATNTVAS